MEFWQGKIFWKSDMESFSWRTVYFRSLSEKWCITSTHPIYTPPQVLPLNNLQLIPIDFFVIHFWNLFQQSFWWEWIASIMFHGDFWRRDLFGFRLIILMNNYQPTIFNTLIIFWNHNFSIINLDNSWQISQVYLFWY